MLPQALGSPSQPLLASLRIRGMRIPRSNPALESTRETKDGRSGDSLGQAGSRTAESVVRTHFPYLFWPVRALLNSQRVRTINGGIVELWQWALAILGGVSATFILAAIVWGMWDVLGDIRLDPASRIVWVLVMAFVPLFGVIAWLYAKPRLSSTL